MNVALRLSFFLFFLIVLYFIPHILEMCEVPLSLVMYYREGTEEDDF